MNTSWIARAIIGAIGEDRQLLEPALLRNRQGVGDDDLADAGRLQSFGCRRAQNTVGRGDDDVRRTFVEQGLRRFRDGAAGVDHVVDDNTHPILDLADD